MNKKQLIASLCERSFSPQVTMGQIIEEGRSKFMDWNIRQEILTISNEHDEVVGMFLKFQHSNYDDLLLITLGWDDLYHIRFMDSEKCISHEVEGLYFDQLFEVIDRYINSLTPKIVDVNDLCLN
jgi:hypothetical protein